MHWRLQVLAASLTTRVGALWPSWWKERTGKLSSDLLTHTRHECTYRMERGWGGGEEMGEAAHTYVHTHEHTLSK